MHTAVPTATLIERLRAVKRLTIRVYYRQSLGEDKQCSVEMQQIAVRRLARSLGITDEEFDNAIRYVDINRSGDDFAGREDFDRLLQEVQRGDVVLSWKQGRLGRHMVHTSYAIHELVQARKCNLFLADKGPVAVTMRNAVETATVMLNGFGDQAYVESVRENVATHLRTRAEQGYATGKPGFGYRLVLENPNVDDRSKSKKLTVIYEPEAAVLRGLAQLVEYGYGCGFAANEANKAGAISPQGQGWDWKMVKRKLQSAKYAGHWSFGHTRVVGRRGDQTIREKTTPDDLVHCEMPHLAIIDPAMWKRVQAQLAATKAEFPPHIVASNAASYHMLSGILKCDICGGRMRVNTKSGRRRGKQRYYVCVMRLRQRCSNSFYLPADEAESKVAAHLADVALPQVGKQIGDNIRNEARLIAESSASRTDEAAKLQRELDTLERENRRLVALAAATDEPVPAVVQSLNANQKRTKTLTAALAATSRPTLDEAEIERLESEARSEVTRLRGLLTPEHTRTVLTTIFPEGLRFRVGSGLWLIEGAGCVPTRTAASPAARPQGNDHFAVRKMGGGVTPRRQRAGRRRRDLRGGRRRRRGRRASAPCRRAPPPACRRAPPA